MTTSELIKLLQNLEKVHGDKPVASPTREGKLSHQLGVHLKGGHLIIEGDHL